MLYKHFTQEILGLQDVIITKVENNQNEMIIYDCLKEEEKQQVNVMLYYSVNISRAHWYKESFLKALTTPNPDQAKSALLKWIHNAESCGLLPFEKCATTFQNWYSGIINSLYSSITNGFTEGCNNKIKVLKRNAYGYNFYSVYVAISL